MNILKIEKTSLKQGRILNIIMGIMGVSFAILSNSSALMVDGLYFMVNFASSIIAAGVSAKIAMDADEKMVSVKNHLRRGLSSLAAHSLSILNFIDL